MNGRSRYEPVDFLGDPPPRDFVALLVVLFVTFTLGYLAPAIPRLLFLSPDVWQSGYLWQLVTYIFAAPQDSPFWFLISLLILYMFGKEVRRAVGRRPFWQLLIQPAVSASLVAVLAQLVGGFGPLPFVIMQGDRMVLAILIAAFATLNKNAVIRLFFVLPIRARDFLWLEILFAFMAFLPTGDFAGFLGISTAVAMTYSMLSGGIQRTLREWRLRIERLILEVRLRRMRRRRKLRIVKPDDGGDARRGPWIH